MTECYLFETCIELSTTGCDDDCISGEETCPPLTCSEYGICNGPQIGINQQVSTEDDCLSLCKDNHECFWYSYNATEQSCSLMSACDEVDSCNNDICTYGQKKCSLGRPGKTSGHLFTFNLGQLLWLALNFNPV